MDIRIRLERFASEAEFSSFARLAFDEQVMVMNMGRVFTQEEAKGYFSYMLEYNRANPDSGSYKVFLEDASTFLGTGAVWISGEEAEITYMVLPEFWNRGYATEITRQLTGIAKQHPGLRKIVAFTDPENIPSQKVLRKNGFFLEELRKIEEDQSMAAVYSLPL